MVPFEHEVHDAVEQLSPNLLNVVYMLDIKDKCKTCEHFNKVDDIGKQSNDCQGYGDCIATTLHPTIQEKIWKLL
jgi:hypothetical protein